MSNEYKDWTYDVAKDLLIENGQLNSIEYMTNFQEGFLIIGRADDGVKEVYFVWLDEEYGWSWTQINI